MISFLKLDDVFTLHAEQIARFGGDSGIRDLDLLKSALGTPEATYDGEYLHTDIYEMAAAYLFHICKNHPFVDGNKRTAYAAAFLFLGLNDEVVRPTAQAALEAFVVGVADGSVSKAEATVYLRKICS